MKLSDSGRCPAFSRKWFCRAVSGHGTLVVTIKIAHTTARACAQIVFGHRQAMNPPTSR